MARRTPERTPLELMAGGLIVSSCDGREALPGTSSVIKSYPQVMHIDIAMGDKRYLRLTVWNI